MKRTTVYLPDDLLKRAKKKAAGEERTLTALIEEGLRLVLAPREGPAGKKRKLPRVSRAKGGLMPGIESLKLFQQIEEMEDIERFGRTAVSDDTP
jgi:hypothetical protein